MVAPVQTYSAQCICLNCSTEFSVKVPKGTPLERDTMRESGLCWKITDNPPTWVYVTCPNCEMRTVMRQVGR